MTTSDAKVRVFIASSLDGFIAGPDGDLSWLPQPEGGEDYGYHAFMVRVGALLMGRSTYDVVDGFVARGEVPGWPYGEMPVLVATHRALDSAPAAVQPVDGTIEAIVDAAKAAARGKDVYLDGGALIRQALDAGLVDTLTISLIPIVLGAGAPLFAGSEQRRALELLGSEAYPSGVVQVRYASR